LSSKVCWKRLSLAKSCKCTSNAHLQQLMAFDIFWTFTISFTENQLNSVWLRKKSPSKAYRLPGPRDAMDSMDSIDSSKMLPASPAASPVSPPLPSGGSPGSPGPGGPDCWSREAFQSTYRLAYNHNHSEDLHAERAKLSSIFHLAQSRLSQWGLKCLKWRSPSGRKVF
jgi:hypothetical protein